MTNTSRPMFTVGVMTRVAILAAAASILFLIEIPVVAFYKLDLSNIPVLLGVFSMGPVPGLMILALKKAAASFRRCAGPKSKLRNTTSLLAI